MFPKSTGLVLDLNVSRRMEQQFEGKATHQLSHLQKPDSISHDISHVPSFCDCTDNTALVISSNNTLRNFCLKHIFLLKMKLPTLVLHQGFLFFLKSLKQLLLVLEPFFCERKKSRRKTIIIADGKPCLVEVGRMDEWDFKVKE